MKNILTLILFSTVLLSCKLIRNDSDNESPFNDVYEFNDFLIEKVNKMEKSIDLVFNYMDEDDKNENDLISLINDSKKTSENITNDLKNTIAFGEGGDDFLKSTINYIGAVGELADFMGKHLELFLISDENWDEDAIDPAVNDEFDRILENYENAFNKMESSQEIYAEKNETTVEN